MKCVYEKPSVAALSFLALEALANRDDDRFDATERPEMSESIVDWDDGEN